MYLHMWGHLKWKLSHVGVPIKSVNHELMSASLQIVEYSLRRVWSGSELLGSNLHPRQISGFGSGSDVGRIRLRWGRGSRNVF